VSAAQLVAQREAAVETAWRLWPEAEDIRPQMLTSGEIAVHVKRGRTWTLEHPEDPRLPEVVSA
jgi:hypothetical protein